MTETLNVDICVIGAGSGGLSVAAGAAQLGARTVLIEKHRMGGDCLNTGCVPSKALLAAGHAAQRIGRAPDFGVHTAPPRIDGPGVFAHVAKTIAGIAPMDSTERFEGLGVQVIQAKGEFTGPGTVVAGNTTIRARRFVIATGSRAFVPPIPGIDTVTYHTNETIFSSADLPDHLIVIGGGPIGVELAQAHRHLGTRVSLLEQFAILPKDDPELVDVVRNRLVSDGIDLFESTKVISVEQLASGIQVTIERNGEAHVIIGSDLLVATGRAANVDGLGLELANVRYSKRGVDVDSRLRTSNKKVYAIGDVAGGYQFTHVAGYHAGIVISNALFRWPAKACHKTVPWVTYSAPELAHVGVTEKQAREAHDSIRILRWPFHENDRARTERCTDGLIKVVATSRGKILGCSIVGPSAGELIQPWVLAMSQNLKIGAIAKMIAPYPTLGEISKRVAGSFYTPTLFGERTRKIVRFLAHFG